MTRSQPDAIAELLLFMIDHSVHSQPSPGELRFGVRDWFAWTPGRESRRDWLVWAQCEGVAGSAEPMPVLPAMLRRRVTPIGQKALGAALACEGVQNGRYVLASRHGEFDRTIKLLTSLAMEEPPSPAEFSMSVHHGLAGLLSIHTGNRLGHTAVAGAIDSFGYGLMEAASCLVEVPETPVLLIYFDDPLPGSYADFRVAAEAELPLAMAFTLTAQGDEALSLCYQPSDGAATAENLSLSFLRFLLGRSQSQSAIGGEMVWRWQRV
jgi:hypothetical protein